MTVDQRLLSRKVDLHGRAGHIEYWNRELDLPLTQKLKHFRQMPQRGVAAMHGRRKALVMPQHKLAQVLPRLANDIGDIGQADIVRPGPLNWPFTELLYPA